MANKIRQVPGNWASVDEFKASAEHTAIANAITGFTPGDIDVTMEYRLEGNKIWINYNFDTDAKLLEFKTYLNTTDSIAGFGQSLRDLELADDTFATTTGWTV